MLTLFNYPIGWTLPQRLYLQPKTQVVSVLIGSGLSTHYHSTHVTKRFSFLHSYLHFSKCEPWKWPEVLRFMGLHMCAASAQWAKDPRLASYTYTPIEQKQSENFEYNNVRDGNSILKLILEAKKTVAKIQQSQKNIGVLNHCTLTCLINVYTRLI